MPGGWALQLKELQWPPHPPPPPPPPPPPLPPPPLHGAIYSNALYFMVDAHPAVSSLGVGFLAVILYSCVRHVGVPQLGALLRSRRGHRRVATDEEETAALATDDGGHEGLDADDEAALMRRTSREHELKREAWREAREADADGVGELGEVV